jgi:hypothetical protein
VTSDTHDSEHDSDSESTRGSERASDATRSSNRSHACLVERNRLLRERVDCLKAEPGDATTVESLRVTVSGLEGDLTDRDQTIRALEEESKEC